MVEEVRILFSLAIINFKFFWDLALKLKEEPIAFMAAWPGLVEAHMPGEFPLHQLFLWFMQPYGVASSKELQVALFLLYPSEEEGRGSFCLKNQHQKAINKLKKLLEERTSKK